MKANTKNNKSDEISYLIDADTFSELGEPIHIPGVISVDKCRKYAKSNHKTCEGRGILNFDDAKTFIGSDGKRQVLTRWRRSCDCVNRKLAKNRSLIG